MVKGIRELCQSKDIFKIQVFGLYPTMASVISEEPPYNQEPRTRKTTPASNSNVTGEKSDPEKNIHQAKNATNDIIEAAEEIEDVSLVNYCFQHEDSFVISRDIKAIEAGSANYCLGCCKLDSVNQYLIKNSHQKTIMVAKENSSSLLQMNPCFCCECICWLCDGGCCCDSDIFSKQRPFNITVYLEHEFNDYEERRPVISIKRTCCSGCCLQSCSSSAQVLDSSGNILGSVQQKCSFPTGKFEVKDEVGSPVFTIRTPCTVTTLCTGEDLCWADETCCAGSAGTFSIQDEDGEEVGGITKMRGDVAMDHFRIVFPVNCDVKIKAVLLSTLILFDYVFSES